MTVSFASKLSQTFSESDMRSVVAAITSITSVGAALGLTAPLLALLMERKGISSAYIGYISAAAGLAAVIAIPFVTAMARQFGVVNTIVGGILLSCFCLASFYMTDPLPWWFLVQFLMSCCLSAVFVLSEFWINHAVSEKNRGVILGIYGTVLSIGFATGAGIVSIVGIDGFLPFGTGIAVILCAIPPVLIARNNEPVLEREEKTPSIIPYLTVVPLATAAVFVFGAVEQSEFSLLPVFASKAGYGEATSSFLLTVLLIGNVIFQIPLGIWSDKVSDRRRILLFCATVGLLGAILMPIFADNLWVLYGIVILWGGVIGGLYTVGLAHLGSRLTGTDLAQANAAFVLCYALGMMVGPPLVGASMDTFGSIGFGGGLALLFILYLVLYAFRTAGRAAR